MLMSQFSTDFDPTTLDQESIEQMAWLMGVDIDALRAKEAERARLHEIAWKRKDDPNWETSKAFHRYEEVFSHNGKQVFYNDWHDVYAIFGLKNGMKDVKTLDEAIRLVYND